MKTSQSPRRRLLLAALVSLLPFSSAIAQTSIDSFVTVYLKGGDLPSTLSFTPFNSSLGTLQSVTLEYNGIQRFDFSLWNNKQPPGQTNPVHYTYQPNITDPDLGSSALILDGVNHPIPVSPIYSGTVSLTSQLQTTIDTARNDARAAFYSGLDPTSVVSGSGGYSVYGTLPVSGSLTLSNSFNGLLLAQFEPITSAGFSTGNVSTAEMQELDFNGTLKVTYTFIPIPEPSTYAAILGAVTLGVVAIRRRKPGVV